jgi:hypothetical protein
VGKAKVARTARAADRARAGPFIRGEHARRARTGTLARVDGAHALDGDSEFRHPIASRGRPPDQSSWHGGVRFGVRVIGSGNGQETRSHELRGWSGGG